MACHWRIVLLSALIFGFVAAPAWADDSTDLSSLDLQQLLNLKVITASKFSEKMSGAPGMISVVRQDELRRFGGMTLGEILDRVAGLAPSTASFTDRSMVAARGGPDEDQWRPYPVPHQWTSDSRNPGRRSRRRSIGELSGRGPGANRSDQGAWISPLRLQRLFGGGQSHH
jgi:hypothetical protein